ncbi:hypothetical protein ACXM5X_30120 [Pseudomonas saponiphila]|uniref:Uncharacterized protein n=1 Tax=Pseudomonas saponiphila TaxID=556534 RepID=A0A1H4Q1A2_9PSED|nr:hypothetical protein SAMN05216178_3569 [Pseudomonas saponiphila]
MSDRQQLPPPGILRLIREARPDDVPARGLLAKAGFQPSGVVENLDEGDPELIFFKPVR